MLKAVNQVLSKTDHKFEFIDLGGGMGITYSNKNKKLKIQNEYQPLLFDLKFCP